MSLIRELRSLLQGSTRALAVFLGVSRLSTLHAAWLFMRSFTHRHRPLTLMEYCFRRHPHDYMAAQIYL